MYFISPPSNERPLRCIPSSSWARHPVDLVDFVVVVVRGQQDEEGVKLDEYVKRTSATFVVSDAAAGR